MKNCPIMVAQKVVPGCWSGANRRTARCSPPASSSQYSTISPTAARIHPGRTPRISSHSFGRLYSRSSQTHSTKKVAAIKSRLLP